MKEFKYDLRTGTGPEAEDLPSPEITKKEFEEKLQALKDSLPLDRPVWDRSPTLQERTVFVGGLRDLISSIVNNSGYLSDEEKKDFFDRLYLIYDQLSKLNALSPKIDLVEEMKNFLYSSRLGEDLKEYNKERAREARKK